MPWKHSLQRFLKEILNKRVVEEKHKRNYL